MDQTTLTTPQPVSTVSWRLELPQLAFAILTLFLMFKINLVDPDYFWHLKTGEYILAHGGLPAGDPFSFTFQGKPWVLHEWLFEVVLYAVFAYLGPAGVKLLTVGLGMLATYVAYRSARQILGGSNLALMLAVAIWPLLIWGFSPRPQLFSYLLLALLVHRLVVFKYFHQDRHLWALPFMMILWTNIHGAFVIGILLLVTFCACEWWLLRTEGGAAGGNQRQRLVRLTRIALVSIAATAINPDFVGHWLYPFQVMNLDFSKSVIAEWQSPNFQGLFGKLYLLLCAGFLLASVYRRKKPDVTEMALPLLFMGAGFISIRHVPLAVLVFLPFIAVALRDSRLPALYQRWVGSGKQQGGREQALNWILLGLAATVLYGLHPAQQAKALDALNGAMPVKAVDFIERQGLTGRMFNEYGEGGYLIYRLYPQQHVLIDGRADLYGDDFVKEYVKISSGHAGWEPAFDRYHIDYAVLRRDAAIRQLLLARGDFVLAYDDEQHSVLVKKGATLPVTPATR